MVFGFPEQRLCDFLGNDTASEDPREGIVDHPLETAFEAIDTAHSIFLSSASACYRRSRSYPCYAAPR
ncbi:hypothetical protein GCM10009836_62630 [Pseudonocardia ailaonensis]|uniref:Uncharacterized protein n=1 Tax=Pseudonocardia ailaonensis TaxID=367279 RepID=A0ABN2NL94_9PSEU